MHKLTGLPVLIRGSPMQHKIDSKGAVGQRADSPDLGDGVICCPIEKSQNAEITSVVNRGYTFRIREPRRGHNDLDNRMHNVEDITGDSVDHMHASTVLPMRCDHERKG